MELQILKLNSIIAYSLLSFLISFLIYPIYIKILQYIKAGKTLRDMSTSWIKAKIFKKLHSHKVWIPTMWWAIFLVVTFLMIILSIVFQNLGYIKNSLFSRQETWIILFAFFSMWILWLIDDFLNIKWVGNVKWLTAKMKLIWMFLFSAFISYWFYFKLWIDWINIWPIDRLLYYLFSIDLPSEIHLWFFYFIFTFVFTVAIVNAVNITDWLDWLAGWLILIILFVLSVASFFEGWYLTTTILAVVMWILWAFLWFNINPAKIFMWDSWSLALWWLIVSVIYLLNIRMGIFIPFLILFLIFWIELFSSFIQIFWKKIFHRKIFPIAPFHHYLEYKWMKEYTIVMKFWLVQSVLALIVLIMIFYQIA